MDEQLHIQQAVPSLANSAKSLDLSADQAIKPDYDCLMCAMPLFTDVRRPLSYFAVYLAGWPTSLISEVGFSSLFDLSSPIVNNNLLARQVFLSLTLHERNLLSLDFMEHISKAATTLFLEQRAKKTKKTPSHEVPQDHQEKVRAR